MHLLNPENKINNLKRQVRTEEESQRIVRRPEPGKSRLNVPANTDSFPSQYPVVVGGVSQCRSICSSASFHSYAKQSASCCASSASGVRPPHISGLAASLVATLELYNCHFWLASGRPSQSRVARDGTHSSRILASTSQA